MSDILAQIAHGLIVSCQAPTDSPLHDPVIISAMAEAAMNYGVAGVRIDTPSHIKAVKQRIPHAPIIGIWKQVLSGYDVYITPRFEEADAIASSGADIIAIDATLRNRPNGETVQNLIKRIHEDLGKLVMADIDTLEAAIQAVEAGADIVATTLYGYTNETKDFSPPGFDLLRKMVEIFEIPVICEGGIASPNMAKKALELGAHSVVVGSDITGIDYKLKAYQSFLTL
jgi:N-acylglucosamine-6-phosphate 2-epimerase